MNKKFIKFNLNRTLLVILLMTFISIGLTGCKEKKDNNEDVANPTNTLSPTPEISDTPEPTKSIPDTTNQNEPVFYGEWAINQVLAYGSAGTYSKEDAEELVGKTLSFSTDKATCFGDQPSYLEKVATNPVYVETIISDSEFVTNYRNTFESIGVEADSITEVNAYDLENNGCTFFVKDENTLILFGGGTYFELTRNTADASDENETVIDKTNALVYVKMINFEKKIITFDEVELLSSTDVERLAEIGMTSEDLVTDFYIYNEDENLKWVNYKDTLSIELLDGTKLEKASLKDLEELVNERELLCNITFKDTEGVKISEQYLP